MSDRPEVVAEGNNEITAFFVRYVNNLVDKVDKPKSKKIIVSAGPYRCYDIAYEYNENTHILRLDFYSVARHNGFKSEDIKSLLQLI